MERVTKMNAKEFAEFLFKIEDNKFYSFGCSYEGDNLEELDPTDVCDLYFATIISVPDEESRFILIDYSGGEEAFVIPLNSYQKERDEDDERIIRERINQYFSKENRFLNGINDYIYLLEEHDDE